jgi:hypothetical protein
MFQKEGAESSLTIFNSKEKTTCRVDAPAHITNPKVEVSRRPHGAA